VKRKAKVVAPAEDLRVWPAPGELWVLHQHEIVMIVAVGWKGAYGCLDLPNYVQCIGVGQVGFQVPGRYAGWRYDRPLPEEERDYFSRRPHGADRIYFEPWQGKGVFYATKDGCQMQKLLEQWRSAVHAKDGNPREIELKAEALASKQLAFAGFK
jgi:hypothetical protein